MTKVAIIGAGSIGVSWSIVFARSGMQVRLMEPDSERQTLARQELRVRLNDMDEFGLLGEAVSTIAARVHQTADVGEAISGASHVQECAPESLGLKRSIFIELDALAEPSTTLGSSSSAIPASQWAADVNGRDRCLVVHPGNPPHLLPVVEVVPADFTAEWAIDQVVSLLESINMVPIRLRHELEGFVFNRLQGAVLREAYCLVRDGVVTPREIDSVMVNGLGRRWSVLGPFATAELNTRGGIVAHAERLGGAYARMGAERGQHDLWTDDLVSRVAEDLHQLYRADEWDQNVRARDRALMLLEQCRRNLETSSETGEALS